MGSFFDLIFINPITNILVAFYQVFHLLHFPYALGFAIVGLTVAIRFILYPFTASQIKASVKMQKIAPHLSKIKEKHKGDSARIQQETLKAYKEHGVNPAAGCLPILIQLPLIWALYAVLRKIVEFNPTAVVTEVNKVVYFDFLKLQQAWDSSFFGISLGAVPSQVMSFDNLFSSSSLILLVPIFTGLSQFVLSKMMIPDKTGEAALEKSIEKKAHVDKKDAQDFASAFQTQSVFIFPVMIGFFSFGFPLGLSLYWNTFSIFGIIQQYKITGLGGLKGWIKKK